MPRQKSDQFEQIANFFYELGTMRKTARGHRQTLLTDDLSDNIASHSYRVTAIGYFLAKLEKANVEKVLTMCVFHDTGEARSGDQNWIHKLFVTTHEDEIAQGQPASLPQGKELMAIYSEYQERKTQEAKVAKDADLLDQLLLLKEYTHLGNQEAKAWLTNKHHITMLSTKSAKQLGKWILKLKPSDWWSAKKMWTPKRRK